VDQTGENHMVTNQSQDYRGGGYDSTSHYISSNVPVITEAACGHTLSWRRPMLLTDLLLNKRLALFSL